MREAPPSPPARGWTLLVAGGAGLLFAGLAWFLWPEWSANPDLSHGFFAPLLTVLLLRTARSQPGLLPATGAWWMSGLALLVVLACSLFAAAGLYAVSLGWSHALVRFVLSVGAIALGFAGLLWLAAAPVLRVPLNWPALAALLLWLLVIPLPPGTYSRLTLALQDAVTAAVLQTLQLGGIPAAREGNLITLASTVVGVEEACSGVRSLISCLFAGLFFAAFSVRFLSHRLLLLGLAGPLAVLLNYFRSLTLTLLANGGVDISGPWHDATGVAVLGFTAVLLGGLAWKLESREARSAATALPQPAVPAAPFSRQTAWGAGLVAAGYAAVAILVGFFVLATRPRPIDAWPAPILADLFPEHAEGWTRMPDAELYRFEAALQTSHLLQRSYVKAEGRDAVIVTAYIAWWPPGQASVSQVASHTPDACWPGTGWQADESARARVHPSLTGRVLPATEHRLFRKAQFPQYVWFWHLHDRKVIEAHEPRSPRELLRIALRYGFDTGGDQFFVRLSANRPWSELAGDPLVEELFSRLQQIGL